MANLVSFQNLLGAFGCVNCLVCFQMVFCQIWCDLCVHGILIVLLFYSFFPPTSLQLLPMFCFDFSNQFLTYLTHLKNVEIQDARLCEMYDGISTYHEREMPRKGTFLNAS